MSALKPDETIRPPQMYATEGQQEVHCQSEGDHSLPNCANSDRWRLTHGGQLHLCPLVQFCPFRSNLLNFLLVYLHLI